MLLPADGPGGGWGTVSEYDYMALTEQSKIEHEYNPKLDKYILAKRNGKAFWRVARRS